MKAITELHGTRAVPRQQPDGLWTVVTAFLGMPMGTRFAPGKFGPPGPTWDLTEDQAKKCAAEWNKFLEEREAGETSSDAKRRRAPVSTLGRSR